MLTPRLQNWRLGGSGIVGCGSAQPPAAAALCSRLDSGARSACPWTGPLGLRVRRLSLSRQAGCGGQARRDALRHGAVVEKQKATRSYFAQHGRQIRFARHEPGAKEIGHAHITAHARQHPAKTIDVLRGFGARKQGIGAGNGGLVQWLHRRLDEGFMPSLPCARGLSVQI